MTCGSPVPSGTGSSPVRAVADILPTLGRMAAGFAIAAVAGIALGVAVGRSRR
jgi:ABC-type nitrate/sulfonate/bicarbonate transport system permease component